MAALVVGIAIVLTVGLKVLSQSARPGISIYPNDPFDEIVLPEVDLRRVDLHSGGAELLALADEQKVGDSDPSETMTIQLHPSLTEERLWFWRWLPERSISLRGKGRTLTQMLNDFAGGFGNTYVKLGRHAIIVPDDSETIAETTAKLCRRALEEMTMPDLAIKELPVKEVLQQLEQRSEMADRYGGGVRIHLDASVTESQLAKRMTTELSGRSFDSQFGWACSVAGLAFEWAGYEEDRLVVDVRPREGSEGTVPSEPFQLGGGQPLELVIHDGDDFKGVYIDLPRESESAVSIWVDEKQVVVGLEPGSVTSTPTGKKIVLRRDGNGSAIGSYRFYWWTLEVSL